jgi:hypothetical protein
LPLLSKKITVICLIQFLLVVSCYGQGLQNVIKGTVYDADSGQPLPGVNAYLSNTSLGDATNDLGYYEFSNIPPGNYDLVFNFIGYEPVTANVDIGPADSLIFDVKLAYAPYQLDSLVVVEDRGGQWRRFLEKFERHFLGRSNNAEQTELMNAEILDFNMESFGVYTAEANRELHIINKALGYESYVQLEHFKWNYFEDTGQALYYVRMKEMEPENKQQAREWALKRSVTYQQSIRYFFVALLNEVQNKTEELEPYESLSQLPGFDRIEHDGQRYKLFNGKITMIPDESRYEQFLPEKNQYQVRGFRFETLFGEMPLSVIPDNGERSYLDYYDKQAIEKLFVIDQNGHLLNPLDVAIGGYWSKFRFADFLPLNYKPVKNL